jgi:NAD(P)-dependent dehydrogenase (short-subunit alcohol dehydrogenase family)
MTGAGQRTVLITGAAAGIGAALAGMCAGSGHAVIGLDRIPCDLTGVEDLVCDLADTAAIDAAISALPDKVDAVASVAGIPGTHPPARVLAVNLLGPRRLIVGVLPRMRPGGAVVTVASVAAHRNVVSPAGITALLSARTRADITAWLSQYPLTGGQAYDTSKHALVRWTRLLAAELLPSGIRAVSVSPGPVETGILTDFAATMGQAALDRSAGTVGRHGRPDEIAAVINFALSPAASWVNGIDIPVEGGLLAARAATEGGAT